MMYNNYYKILLQHSNAEFNDKFIRKIGVIVLNTHDGLTEEAKKLFTELNIDLNQGTFLALSEFNAKITYLSFNSQKNNYHDFMINEVKHLSPYSLNTPNVLIVGCSIEGSLEIIAHNEAKIARLTSSKTKAMNDPYFYLPQKNISQEKLILSICESIKNLDINDIELRNKFFPANKATTLSVGMNIKDWHKTITSRFSPIGVEKEVFDIFELIRNSLKKYYPDIIKDSQYYIDHYK